MDDITIGAFTLTTYHPASHYGIPVLIDKDGRAYGPADPLNTPETDALFGAVVVPAIRIVLPWIARTDPNDPARRAALLYCQQWPEGYEKWRGVYGLRDYNEER